MKSKTPSARQQALFQQARVLHHSGRLTEAAILFQKLLKDFPKDPQLLGELGTIAIELGNFERGAILLEKSLQVYPNEPDVLFNRGLALAKLQRLEAALASFDQAIKLKPLYAQAHYNRADILKNLNRLDGAIESYERAIALRPDYSEAYNDLGLAHWELQQFPQALVCYERAIALKPDYFYAYYNLGNALQYLRRFEEALDCYDNMIALAPDEPGAYFNRGQVLNELKRYAAALNCYDRSLAIKPDYAYLHGQRLFTKLQICDWSNMKKESAELAAKIEAEKKVTTPLTVLACFGQLALHRKAAEIWTADKYPTNPALPKISKYAKHGKIRIGYFSADFRCHAVAFLTAELYEKHDRGRFEVIAFSLGPDTKDDMRLRLSLGLTDLSMYKFFPITILSNLPEIWNLISPSI
ncbi:MAG: tetratricopeptide repeat protein [Methylomonas sp.]